MGGEVAAGRVSVLDAVDEDVMDLLEHLEAVQGRTVGEECTGQSDGPSTKRIASALDRDNYGLFEFVDIPAIRISGRIFMF